MNTITLDTKFFTGGNATFTVDNGKGEHYTFKIVEPKRGDFVPNTRFVKYLTGPDNESSYTYLGKFNMHDGTVALTKGSKLTDDSKPVKVIRWAMKHVFGDRQLPDGYQIRHAGKCGCCGRTLTEPLSLTIGIGPECRKRLGM